MKTAIAVIVDLATRRAVHACNLPNSGLADDDVWFANDAASGSSGC